MPNASLNTLASGARQFVVHDAFEMMWWRSGSYVVLVDAHDEGGVLVGRGRRDQHLLGAGLDVLARVGRLREEAGRLDDDVDAELAPRQVRGVALRERLDRLAVDDDVVVVVVDGRVETARDRVVLQQVGERLVVGEVVHRDDLEVGALGEGGAEVVAADAAEAVDADLYGHGCLLN